MCVRTIRYEPYWFQDLARVIQDFGPPPAKLSVFEKEIGHANTVYKQVGQLVADSMNGIATSDAPERFDGSQGCAQVFGAKLAVSASKGMTWHTLCRILGEYRKLFPTKSLVLQELKLFLAFRVYRKSVFQASMAGMAEHLRIMKSDEGKKSR